MTSHQATPTGLEYPRRYVDPQVTFDEWAHAEVYYRELADREVDSAQQLENWLLDWSELDAVFDEEGIARRIEMTRATDDPQSEQRYLYFVENVQPHREPWQHRLRQKFVGLCQRFPLPPRRYQVLERAVRNAIELYRDENVPLLTEDAKLIQQYQKITGAMTVSWEGRELTLPQLARYLEEPDRAVREASWRVGSERFLADAPALDELYEKMVRLRHRIARNAGLENYRDYRFRALERFDYTPVDCFAFHEAIEKVVVPAAATLARERCSRLGLETLRPWDMAVDPEGRPPLRPFETAEQLAAGCAAILHKVDTGLGRVFEEIRQRGLVDLASRKGKAPGGYQETYQERRLPFIFMNAVGTEGDVRTLLHESGHALHTWACRSDPLIAYRNYPIEFAEVASMGMECLALPHLEEFYGGESDRARRRFFSEIINFLPYMARVDALQHYVYTHVEEGLEAWNERWQQLTQRFSPFVDWSGLERFDQRSWQRKLHFYEVPLYYVEYGIAQLGALQVWIHSRRDYGQAVALYRNALALGGSRPLPELFEASGLRFDFTERTLRPLADAVMEEIARLG